MLVSLLPEVCNQDYRNVTTHLRQSYDLHGALEVSSSSMNE